MPRRAGRSPAAWLSWAPPRWRGGSCQTRRSASWYGAEIDERLAAARDFTAGGDTERAAAGIVKLFGNGCGAVDVSGLGGER